MSEYNDNSTVYVSQWLLHWGVPFIRIDKEETYVMLKTRIENNIIDFVITSSNEKEIKITDIAAVWYRRGDLTLSMPDLTFIQHEHLHREIHEHLSTENKALQYYFYHLMEEKPHIGTFRKRSVNKLIVLYEAQKAGLEIPSTFVLSSKNIFDELPFPELITKGIFEGFKADFEFGKYTTYTEVVDKKAMPDVFFSSLFQSAIDKEADIRVFYLSGEFYSMAIRSQTNEQTSTDFRKYLTGIGNRSFPFQLPVDIQERLHMLMLNLELNTGSIDLIFTKDGRFVFLEVNPVGQFGMTSIPCNYFLEKRIASLLKEMSTK